MDSCADSMYCIDSFQINNMVPQRFSQRSEDEDMVIAWTQLWVFPLQQLFYFIMAPSSWSFFVVTQMSINQVMFDKGWQNMLPQNLPLWHKDYFKLKAVEKKWFQEKFYAFLPFA